MTDSLLATRCPHCQTRFRVTRQQLHLHAGTVRCGSCREIFQASDYLGEAEAPAAQEVSHTEESGRMTLMDFSALQGGSAAQVASNMQDELDALSKAITDLQNKPWREPVPAAEPGHDWDEDEPGFVQQARKKKADARTRKILLLAGIPFLLLCLLAQLTYLFRNDIAVRAPQLAPTLRTICTQFGCDIALSAQIDALSLQSSQLVAVPDQTGQFELIALLRNQSKAAQTWPALELMLKDETEQAQVRKVFLPAVYLPRGLDPGRGFDAQSESELRIRFALADAHAAGFQLTLFYP